MTILIVACIEGVLTLLSPRILPFLPFPAMKRSPGAGKWLRRVLGAAVLGSVASIAAAADAGLLPEPSGSGTARLEQRILNAFHASKPDRASLPAARNGVMRTVADTQPVFGGALPVEGRIPSLSGAVDWVNSPPLTAEQLRGKVVLVDFWTYSCINCIRTLPYLRNWAAKYKGQGLTVVGVHTPEFAFEKNTANVRKAIDRFRIGYPVAVDSNYAIWRAFGNNAWPAFYIIDAQGRIRHHQFGEGDYDKAEKVIQALLREAGNQSTAIDPAPPEARGAEAAPDFRNIGSSETYIGYQQASNFASLEGLKAGAARDYTIAKPALNRWGLSGNWTMNPEQATLNRAGGGITYRFRARDLHLVLGPGADGKPARFQVTIDGKAPGGHHGADIDAGGNGTVTDTRLYQLVRQAGEVSERTFEIRFLDPGVQAFAFTFG
ncbi:thioredoxin family protein [Cupriavidus sp. IDO]|uniref:thioredoxin family protein n=1 Tax=Cupriavidus sp. IDO TaxID=1539142 RepID=UPI00068D155B|nr:thioredoxin family protein [Cupriavidus sp. IDO]KWR89160.1 hypothetical protein RM96_15960 [Cupriavidus sp. IDO]